MQELLVLVSYNVYRVDRLITVFELSIRDLTAIVALLGAHGIIFHHQVIIIVQVILPHRPIEILTPAMATCVLLQTLLLRSSVLKPHLQSTV